MDNYLTVLNPVDHLETVNQILEQISTNIKGTAPIVGTAYPGGFLYYANLICSVVFVFAAPTFQMFLFDNFN